ncbi:hypothetical protein NK553_28450 [Pseudomonas sp. ZM23]|uniref:cGAS/DncV-like nucleotidyltransferase C-terminal helical domain-containing protein n=1 Tax=Pseudomonas triclosanedens TaxID=2961893 RepID=A0ABY6ZVL1_9PSED|nr:hypothetical protein [Pseudomonas triclosanedens]MCP8467887.1 hypothetical protein [Pseudomonas triclosanedens]MCP8473859.1 hypothetical protein [Pseudomonas triclosanedens]MCP8479815.1 hypothetical protein [Pseudomonas triclosanedens]WAI48755.1 hypothetical protein OU419_23835 [Pseudomonas triclosanedens]
MVANINNYLSRMRARRNGTDRLSNIALDERISVLTKSLNREGWEGRVADKPYTRYALGAMQEVSPEYTRVSLETAERVGSQLKSRLEAKGLGVEFRLQGSVPLNVHIRGVSDVDLLTLDRDLFTYSVHGPKSKSGLYGNPANKTSLGTLLTLRSAVEEVLPDAFPAADVNIEGSKAVKISGGSLARPVDVIPSHWFDCVAYQVSGAEHDRAVTILDKGVPCTLDNFPFLHIKRIGDRCDTARGGLRKSIRLCKNVKADAEEEGRKIDLSSFDIASAMYYADMSVLGLSWYYELSVLAETQRHLKNLNDNKEYAKSLLVPDESRKIFDTSEKLVALGRLSSEINDLLESVAKENSQILASSLYPDLVKSRQAVSSLKIN